MTMTGHVQSLLDFHATTSFGTRENLVLRQRHARLTYLALTDDERNDLARESIAQTENGNDRFQEALCCLACFHPGSLSPFHQTLLGRQSLYPGVIFHGASSEIARQIITLCHQGDCHNHALTALAWIGDDVVQAAFSRWRKEPPAWRGKLHVPPHCYAEAAGWELTDAGQRHDLFHSVAFPLVSPARTSGDNDSVVIGASAEESCDWCKRKLVTLFAFSAIEDVLGEQGVGKVQVVTCHACTCFGPLFMKVGPDGKTKWHPKNQKPSYLPTNSSEWDGFPASPLVMTKETRPFMEAANWSMVPGVAFSQVGGLPTWIQGAEYPLCPDCTQKMPFVGQISNEDFMEFGEGIYYAFRCPHCKVTATCYQQT
jgi:hypothetical protein